MTINKLITTKNKTVKSSRTIKYIVIHYVGATGGAEANARYFQSTYRGASAHYFVGHAGEIWQSVEDKDIAWHVGASSYKHTSCRNSNSIGIELCCKYNGRWYFNQETVNEAIRLTKMLMAAYKIPASNVIRHYDVTGKMCPEPYVRDTAAWNNFKAALSGTASGSTVPSTPTPTPTPSTSTQPMLKFGSKGTYVTDAQTKLTKAGLSLGSIDGIFGTLTKNAVMRFQRAKGLAVDGIIGPLTWAQLNKVGTTTSSTTTSTGSTFVKQVQNACNALGSNLVVDGIYGPKTAAALPMLKVGSKGTLVKLVQQKVGASADSIFGAKTKSSVMAYQKSKGLVADGVVGPKTWAKMLG